MTIPGLHHVTAITADGQRNIDFYTGVLGLRLVKVTVNFADPTSYHLYYGDELGRPGSALTFFVWGVHSGRIGPPQVSATAFSIPPGSTDYWIKRFEQHGVSFNEPTQRFGETVTDFVDPEDMELELLVPSQPDPREPWPGGPVPAEHAIRGFHSVTLSEEAFEHTARLLTETMQFRHTGDERNRNRFTTGDGGAGAILDVLCVPDSRRGTMGTGTVHHVAWRAPDDDAQKQWQQKLSAAGRNVTPIVERHYFRSIYFREPGGVLFEIATDAPGFTVDEPPDKLGTRLKLPEWLEPSRRQLEAILPPLRLPQA